MEEKKPEITEEQVDVLLDAVGSENSEKLLAELLAADAAATAAEPPAVTPKAIRAKIKTLTANNPALIARIIQYWMNEERNKRR